MSWRTPILDKTLLSGAAVLPYRFVRFGAADNLLAQASAATDAIIGVSGQVGAGAAGLALDFTLLGIGEVTLGDTVARGNSLTADSAGRAVVATAGNSVGGVAMKSGVVGDVIPVLLAKAGDTTTSALYQADVTVSAAEVLALNATPKQLVAAPGAGYALVFNSALIRLAYASVAYNGIAAGEDLEVRYTNGSGGLQTTIETTGFLDATADALRWVRQTTAAALTLTPNAPLVLALAAGEVATGNSPLNVRIFYHVVPAAI